MKHSVGPLLFSVLILSSVGLRAADQLKAEKLRVQPHVSECFTVHALVKTDADHYWADWTNNCPYTLDKVYVMVTFTDKSHKTIGEGVWPMYFVEPGRHRVTRFSVPAVASSYEFVHVRRITQDSEIALR